MADDVFCSSGQCARLSRRLGIQAFAGLLALAGLVVGLIVASIVTLFAASGSFVAGDVAGSLLWLLGSAVALVSALRCGRWLFVPDPGPQGVPLAQQSAGSLHRLIERVGTNFCTVKVDAVWVTGDMNAAVLQRPRWGLFGPMQTHILIGLPLIHSLSDRQFPALLAHEFGHLACQRQGVAAWGCHFRAWSFRAMDRCIEDLPALAGIIERCCGGYFEQAQRLARLEEFEADHAAARVVGAGLVAETLVEVALKERFLAEDYWHQVIAESAVRPAASLRPYRDMGLGMAAGFCRSIEQDVLRRSLADGEDQFGGLHPSLSERLLALGVVPDEVVVEEGEAAVCHLSPVLPQLAWAFDQAWWAGNEDCLEDACREGCRS
jgi:hypothetical protein